MTIRSDRYPHRQKGTRVALLSIAALALTVLACVDTPSPSQPEDPSVLTGRATTTAAAPGSTLILAPLDATIDVGGTLQFSASAFNPKGKAVNRRVKWSSTDETVATVEPGGLVTAVALGTTTILAHSGSLSATASVTVVSPLPQPVAHFPLDGNALDASGNGRDGTVFGGVTATVGVRGVPGTAMLFDGDGGCPPYACGTPGYIEFGNLDLPGAFSLGAWVKPERRTDGLLFGAIVGKFTGPGNWELNINWVTNEIVAHTSTTAGVFSPSPVVPDVWLHIVATYDGSSTIKIYTDGGLVASGSGFGPASPIPTLPRIGRSSWGGNDYKGAIDDVRIYDVELSAGEVARLYAEAGS